MNSCVNAVHCIVYNIILFYSRKLIFKIVGICNWFIFNIGHVNKNYYLYGAMNYDDCYLRLKYNFVRTTRFILHLELLWGDFPPKCDPYTLAQSSRFLFFFIYRVPTRHNKTIYVGNRYIDKITIHNFTIYALKYNIETVTCGIKIRKMFSRLQYQVGTRYSQSYEID